MMELQKSIEPIVVSGKILIISERLHKLGGVVNTRATTIELICIDLFFI